MTPNLYRILWAQRNEERTTARYFFDNSSRSDAPSLCCIQRTQSGRSFLCYRNRVQYVMPAQAMLFIHGEDSSYGYPPEDSAPYRHDFISFDGPDCICLLNAIRKHSGSVVPMAQGMESTRLFFDCIHRFEQRSFSDRYQESAHVYRLLMTLLAESSGSLQQNDPLSSAHQSILNSYDSPVTVDDIAHSCGMSREHLSRSYSRRYGQSPGKALRELRLQNASELLRNTYASVEQIAARCGYADPDSFARAFARKNGLNPQAYRQQAKLS